MKTWALGTTALAMLAAVTAASGHPAAAPPGKARIVERALVLRPGDTMARLLSGAGLHPGQIQEVLRAVAPLLPVRGLRPGLDIAIQLDPGSRNALVGLEIETAPGRVIRARPRHGGWTAEEVVAPQQRMLAMASGVIDGGLYPALTAAGLPAGLALPMIRALGHQVDFQHDLQPGDRFSVLFERFRDGDGDLLGHGRVLQVELVLSGRRLSFWRYETADGTEDWFDADGQSLHRAFLRTPLDGARISSGFGMRSHPVLGYTRMHRGTDFAAPQGTPVFAAANGVVVAAGSDESYGRIVRLRHAGGIETRYAHLSGVARGIAPGRPVRQGDVLGAVGSTGLATGTHLHYEVLVGGQPVDPASRAMQAARLTGRDLARFQAARQSLARYAARIRPRTEIAMAE
ncbi:M23 family metallopeptidase [Roseicella aquatilis]|uniref:M23 family metallopeptidase n=1 Tax=Roseicella aquatilis TaxID=2527868 RepID=A0A4R4DTK1_9PROT|nr:M23 family metallopeptidase [Roseicella aquatilis]TCZ64953.1 M23 family metallopeptidase [Roseicella aquatilis]